MWVSAGENAGPHCPEQGCGGVLPLHRRALLLGCASLACVSTVACLDSALALPVPPERRLAFRIIRKGSVIGSHVIDFGRDDDRLTVSIAVDIAVGIGPLVLFRYAHEATEQWRGNQLVFMQTQTKDDGTRDRLTVRRDGLGLAVESSQYPPYIAPADAYPGSHWNQQMLQRPVINTQNGRLLRPQVIPLNREKVALASGATVEARHFSVRGDANLDTWYDASPSWVALRFIAHEGSEIRYERV
jgi:hypothetical protein